MKNIKTFCKIMTAVFFCLSCTAKENKSEIKNPAKNEVAMKSYISVSMDEGLKMLSEEKNAVLLDVRRPDEYQAGHMPGAILFTNETMTPEKAENLIPSKNTKLFVYCRSGRRSKEASQKLADYGYTNVVEIGGIMNYSGELEK
ncbi:rhodanese-like domain-containing protein [Treponema sp.]|uniref:rhodanese-like domain-containing protein n=1 Tax=Treponema sp. TaxID=166 RepID=UPI003F116241